MEPFKVRLTGSGSGTLDEVKVTAELVHRVKPSGCPLPWAHYTPQSIQHSGGEVTSWNDVTEGGRHLVPSTGGCSEKLADYSSNVIDGNAGFVSPVRDVGCNSNRDYFATTVDAPQTFEGHTMFVVANPAASNDEVSSFQIFVDAVHNMVLRDRPLSAQQFVGYGSLEGTDSRAFGASAVAAWATPDGLDIEFEVNGTAWQASPSDEDYFRDPNGSPWSHSTSAFMEDVAVIPSSEPGSWIAEIIIYNTALSAECRAQVWSGLASRYPSLGI